MYKVLLRDRNDPVMTLDFPLQAHKGDKIHVRGNWYKVKRVKHYIYTDSSATTVLHVKGVMGP